jgi:hypothetical protein
MQSLKNQSRHTENTMTPRIALASCLLLTALLPAFGAEPPEALPDTVIAIIRHGEKPQAGLGMINCAGLNRSLALGPRLASLVGPPDKIIVPNPSARKADKGIPYDYNRPLLTIGPTAIAAGLPIEATLAWNDHQGLATALQDPLLAGKTIYVAWEHHLALQTVRDIFAAQGSDASSLPSHWNDDDFDTVLVVRIARGARHGARLSQLSEGLDGSLSTACPR